MLRFGIKVLLIPVWIIAMGMKMAVKVLLNLSEFAVGLIMMVFGVCIVITICQQEWTQTALVLAGAGMTIAFATVAASVIGLVESLTTAVGEFVLS